MHVNLRVPNQLKRAFILACIILFSTITFSLPGIIRSPLHVFLNLVTHGDRIAVFGYLMAHTYLFYIFTYPDRREWLIVTGGGLLLATIYSFTVYTHDLPYWHISGIYFAFLGLLALAVSIYKKYFKKSDTTEIHDYVIWVTLLFLVLMISIPSFLQFTSAVRPATYDWQAYIIDLSLGYQAVTLFDPIFKLVPKLQGVLNFAYFILPFTLSILFAQQLCRTKRTPVNSAQLAIFSSICAAVIYLICPVSGPAYAFGELFPRSMPSIDQFPGSIIINSAAARNGVPSMHLGYALLFWINSRPYSPFIRLLFAGMLILVFMATLASGEHYLVDLISAVPFTLAMQSICTFPLASLNQHRKNGLLVGAGLTLFWIVYIEYGYGFAYQWPFFSWVSVLITFYLTFKFFKPLLVELDNKDPEAKIYIEGKATTDIKTRTPANINRTLVISLFFISGFAAIVYQVLFSKILAHIFGSMASATYTVLATYMGGMAIGAWLGGLVIRSRKQPLVIYSICELVIAIYCFMSPTIFTHIQKVYIYFGAGMVPGNYTLDIARFCLGTITLLVPTVLMGMTLPVLIKHFQCQSQSTGISLARLYTSNTVGAAFGGLLAGYLIIPVLGITNTLHISVWLNLLAAGAAYFIATRSPVDVQLGDVPSPDSMQVISASREYFIKHKNLCGIIAIIVLGVSGIVSLGIEVNYIYLLSIVAGNSVYAFALMLFVFLLGLGIGSEVGRKLLNKHVPLIVYLCILQFTLAIALLAGVFFWEKFPDYFGTFLNYPSAVKFSAREFIRAIVCFIAMFPPAFLIGTFYPLCLSFIGQAFANRIEIIGASIALNTVGNIVGVIVAGFLLIPYFGVLFSIKFLSSITMLLGLVFLFMLDRKNRIRYTTLPALCVILFLLQPHQFNYDNLASGANVYFLKRDWGTVIDHAESLDGGLTTVHRQRDTSKEKPVLFLLTNGKFQGANEVSGEMPAQVGFAIAPLLHTSNRDKALVIGYGTGTTARVIHDAGFRHIEIVDLSKDIIEMANNYFSDVNHDVSVNNNVRTSITDGRNYLMLSKEKYNLITVEISSIWFAGAASLYNREFYHLVSQHLADTGILQQWVQLHHITPQDILYIVGTLRSNFRYIWLYVIGGQGIMVASNDINAQVTRNTIAKLDTQEQLASLKKLYNGSFGNLVDTLLLGPDEIDQLLSESTRNGRLPVSTDDNVILEYSTPKGNVLDSRKSFELNFNWLKNFSRQTK